MANSNNKGVIASNRDIFVILQSATEEVKVYVESIIDLVKYTKNVKASHIKTLSSGLDNLTKINNVLSIYISKFVTSGSELDKVSIKIFNNTTKILIHCVKSISDVLNEIDALSIPKFLWFKLFIFKRTIRKVIGVVDDIFSFDWEQLKKMLTRFSHKIIMSAVGEINKIAIMVNSIKIKIGYLITLPVRLKIFKSVVRRILKSVGEIANDLPFMKSASLFAKTKLIKLTILELHSIITSLFELIPFKLVTKIILFGNFHLLAFNIVINFCNRVIQGITSMKAIRNPHKKLLSLASLRIILYMVSGVVEAIRDIRPGLFIRRKIRVIISVLNDISDMIVAITKIKTPGLKQSFSKLKLIKRLIHTIYDIMIKIIILTPIAVVAALVSPVLIAAIALVLTAIIAIVGLLWVASKILSKIKLGGVLVKISLLIMGLTIIMTQMLILAVICMALSMVVEQISLMNIIKFIGEFILLIIIFSVLGLVVSSVGTYILPFGLIMLLTIAFMIVLMGALVVFSVACIVFEKISSLVKYEGLISNILNIIKIVLCVGALAALLGLLIVPFILPIMLGVGFMMMIVGALVLLAIGLKLLEVIDLDPDKVRSGVKTVLDTAMMVIDTIFNTTIEHGEEDGFWSKMLKIVTGPVGMLLKTMLSAQILLASIISVFAMLLIASQLKLLQKLDLNPEDIKKNVRTVLDTVKYIMDLVFSPYTSEEDSESKPWYTKILDWMGGTVKALMYPIMMISTLASSIVAVGAILLIAKQLEILQKLELRTDDIKNNVRSVIDVCKSIISAIWNTDTGEEKSTKGFGLSSLLELVFPEYVQMMHAIMSVGFLSISLISVGLIKKLAEHLTTLNKMPDLSGVKNKVSNVIGAAKEVIDSVFTGKSKILSFLSNSVNFAAAGKNLTDMNNALGIIVKMSKSIEEIELSDAKTENHRKFMENNIKFLDKINTTDLTKLKTTANMFEKMAQFSESINGNFEGLADTLNEKIAPLMEELKELLEGVQDKVEETGANVSKAAYNSGKNLSEPEMQAQVNSENPKAEAEEKARIVQQRMEEQARAQTSAITSKLDELIELMRSGMVQVRTV